jgi:cathepsin B
MKYVLFALLLVTVLCNQEIVDYINSHDFGWKAKHYDRWDGWTIEDFRNYFNVRLPDKPTVVVDDVRPDLEDSFDWRKQKPDCDWAIRDQGQCGSCWAFGLTESLGDRFCIECSENLKLAAEDPVACDHSDYGCGGGYLNNAWDYATKTGIVTQSCFPYVSGDGHVPPCPTSCTGSGTFKKYHAKDPHAVGKTVSAIQTEIKTNGPAEFAFAVYQDFITYSSGVYVHKTGGFLGYHAVKGIGWGTSGTQDYWIIANSWGTSWGMQGWFWILRGSDECGIEDGVYAGEAAC